MSDRRYCILVRDAGLEVSQSFLTDGFEGILQFPALIFAICRQSCAVIEQRKGDQDCLRNFVAKVFQVDQILNLIEQLLCGFDLFLKNGVFKIEDFSLKTIGNVFENEIGIEELVDLGNERFNGRKRAACRVEGLKNVEVVLGLAGHCSYVNGSIEKTGEADQARCRFNERSSIHGFFFVTICGRTPLFLHVEVMLEFVLGVEAQSVAGLLAAVFEHVLNAGILVIVGKVKINSKVLRWAVANVIEESIDCIDDVEHVGRDRFPVQDVDVQMLSCFPLRHT